MDAQMIYLPTFSSPKKPVLQLLSRFILVIPDHLCTVKRYILRLVKIYKNLYEQTSILTKVVRGAPLAGARERLL